MPLYGDSARLYIAYTFLLRFILSRHFTLRYLHSLYKRSFRTLGALKLAIQELHSRALRLLVPANLQEVS